MDSDNNNIMEYEYVTKRNGEKEKVYFDKINARIEKLCEGLKINPTRVTRDITKEMYNGIHTWELDELGAQIAASLCTEHPDYNTLASRIIISNHHKNTSPSFSETMSILYNNTDVHGKQVPLISRELFEVSQKHSVKLNDTIKIRFSSQSFLQNQVRSMVGCLKYLATSKWSIDDFKEAFKSKKRSNCAPPAPPCGLYLYNIKY